VEKEFSWSDKRPSQTTRRHSAQKSSQILRLRRSKNRNKTANPSSSLSGETDPMPNITVLTAPLAISSQHTASSVHRRLSSVGLAASTGQASATASSAAQILLPSRDDKPNDNVGGIAANSPTDERKAGIADGNNVDGDCHCGISNDKETGGVKMDSGFVTVPAHQAGTDEFAIPSQSAAAVSVADVVAEMHAGGPCETDACDVRDTEDVDISDGSLPLDTQMLRAIAGPAAGDFDKITTKINVNVFQQPAEIVTMTNGNERMSEGLLDALSELDVMATASATCQFMKELSTPKYMVQTTATVLKNVGTHVVGHVDCIPAVEAVTSLPEPEPSVNVTSELVAASNFDRICAAGDAEINAGQIMYSEEMFDDLDHCAKYRLSACLSNNRVTSDSPEKLVAAADISAADNSDLFASYIEDSADCAVRAEGCLVDLPAENSFGLAHDSITNTMLDRAMAAVNQPAVCSAPGVTIHSAADAKPVVNADANIDERRDPDADMLPLPNNKSLGLDAEAALNLLCDSSQKLAKKPPKRRGRKRNSDSADPFNKPGTCIAKGKRRQMLSRSPADHERADVNLNDAVCGQTSLSVSFGSASGDSSAYVPPTPPSAGTEKSNVNTPRRLLGGVAGVTPVKSDWSTHKVKKNGSLLKRSHENREQTQHKVSGVAEAAVSECERNTDDVSPPLTQGALISSQSFTVIDVAANRLLFDTFIAEWKQKENFSLSVACEKRPKPEAQNLHRSTEGIGAKFTRGTQKFT